MKQVEQSSFRDPSGFVYYEDGKVFRQINTSCKEDYDELMSSGLYKKLQDEGLIVSHQEIEGSSDDPQAYKCIEVEKIPYILYPYEWSFSQFKDAALLTLRIQQIALEHGMSLKDASAFNIQFRGGSPVLIDTLSFEKLKDGSPWVAYKQFCQHFFAPLLLMQSVDGSFGMIHKQYIDGVPLSFASKMLPKKTWLKMSAALHVHLHARMQSKYADKGLEVGSKVKEKHFSKRALLGLVDQLQGAIKKIKCNYGITEWGEYYSNTNYDDESFKSKKDQCDALLLSIKPDSVADLGANEGTFSRLAAKHAEFVLSADIDPVAVEYNYQTIKKDKIPNVLPMLIDLTNPSPAIGWANNERKSFLERANVDVVLALALIHHISISNNVPLEKSAELFSSICKNLIIEFVPKSDSQVKKLLSTREDIFPSYTIEGFEKAYGKYFNIESKQQVQGSERTLYHLSVHS